MAATVSLKNVIKHYGPVPVVNDIDLEIRSGEFVVLVGPSGCGKSTTLRMVAGLEQISAGTIEIGGRVVNHLAPKDRGVAMVFQNYALYPHLTVRDNISFGLRLARTPRQTIAAEVDRAAGILELSAVLDRLPAELSGGQRQRVAMGRAIVRNPNVFLFDEPLSNLDAKLRTQMRTEIKRLHARLGTTVIYVTHDQLEAMTLADRIVVMRGGHIEQVGTPRELFDTPASVFVAGFIGSPPMNLLPCTSAVLGEQLRLELSADAALHLGAPQALALGAGRSLWAGVRPEDMHLTAGPETQPLNAWVELVEPLGAESLVHVRIGEQTAIVRVDGRQALAADRAITLHVDMQRFYLFARDAAGGERCVYRDARVQP